MILYVWTRDEGITDDTFRDGDIFQIHPDGTIPGNMEKKRWLIVKTPDLPSGSEELISSEYQINASNEPIIRRMRKYRLEYAPKLTPEELALAKDREATVEVIENRYTLDDIVRK